MENNFNATGPITDQPVGIKNVLIQKKLDLILAKIHSKGLSLREGLIIFDWFKKHPDQQNTERDGWTYRGVWDKLASLVAEIEQFKNQYWQLTNNRISTGPELEEAINFFQSLQQRKSEFFPKDPGLDLEREPGAAAVFSLPLLGEMTTTKILIIAGGLLAGYFLIKK